jgi:hypothetical protein
LRALLDEQVPVELAALVRQANWSHDVLPASDMGRNGVKNGVLLREMREAGFGVLVPIDRRIEYQQNIPRSGIGLVVLHSFRARITELAPLAPGIAAALDTIKPGEIIHLHAPPRPDCGPLAG